MSGSSQFKTIATAGGANVITQAQYEAMTALLADGFSSGIAESNVLNKVWRQSSFVTAAVAQLMANITGQAIQDDGNETNFINQLIATINGIDPGSFLGVSGYQKLPGGFILQWGNSTISSNAQTVTFPIAFSTACYGVAVSESAANVGSWGSNAPTIHAVGVRSTVNYEGWALVWSGSAWVIGSISQFYFAIGK